MLKSIRLFVALRLQIDPKRHWGQFVCDRVNSEIESDGQQPVPQDRSIKRLVNIKATRTSR